MNEETNEHQDQQPDIGDNMISKHHFDEVNQKRKDAEESLQSVVGEMVEDIPKQFRELVPNLAPTEQIKWIRNAQKSGLFSSKAPAKSPDSKRPGNMQKPPEDYSGMSASELIRAGLTDQK